MNHPRFKSTRDGIEFVMNEIARAFTNANTPLTRGETIGVILMVVAAVGGLLFLALAR